MASFNQIVECVCTCENTDQLHVHPYVCIDRSPTNHGSFVFLSRTLIKQFTRVGWVKYQRTPLNMYLGFILKENFSFFKNNRKNMDTQWLCALGLENGSKVDGRYLEQWILGNWKLDLWQQLGSLLCESPSCPTQKVKNHSIWNWKSR